VTELGFVEATPKQDGRNMIMVLAPHRRKADGPKPTSAGQAEELPTDEIAIDA